MPPVLNGKVGLSLGEVLLPYWKKRVKKIRGLISGDQIEMVGNQGLIRN